MAIASSPPVVPSKSTGGGGGGSSTGGGGGGFVPISTTPTPIPTPVPSYRLETALPAKVNIGNIPVRIEGDKVTVAQGYLLADIIPNNIFEAPVSFGDNTTGKMIVSIEPRDLQSGTIKSIEVLANKTLIYGGQEIGVSLDVILAGLPEGSVIDFDLVDPASVDLRQINGQLSNYSYTQFNTTPLVVIKATKKGLQNGVDIKNVRFTVRIPRPAGFDAGATYHVIRENEGALDVLNATLVSSPDADTLVFEVVSPRGLSTFSLARDARPLKAAATSTPVTATPAAPKATPVQEPENKNITPFSMTLALVAFAAGVIAGIVVLVIFLWIRISK